MTMICLIDCDNFFASCETLFHPEYRKKPLVVCSSENGIIIARSKEAKALGIPMGGATFDYTSLFLKEDVIVKTPNFTLYSDISQRIRETVLTYNLEMSMYSIDEMFLKIPTPLVCDTFLENIQKKIKQWVGIDVSIGLSKTKTLAKIATKIAKSSPPYRKILTENIEKTLKTFPADDIWGIGKKSFSKLSLHQCKTAYDILSLNDPFLKRLLGMDGMFIKKELEGESAYPFIDKGSQKSIQITKTFPSEIIRIQTIKEIIASFISEGCEKLRLLGKKAGEFSLFLDTSRYKKNRSTFFKSYTLTPPSNYTPDFLKYKEDALKDLLDGAILVKRAGVHFNTLSDEKTTQQDLFSPAKNHPPHLMEAFDQINRRFGPKTIRFASQSKDFSRKGTTSLRYTTEWKEILEVSIQ